MPRKRKAWWMMLRGPRGHRGPPGPGVAPGTYTYKATFDSLDETVMNLEKRVNSLESRIADLQNRMADTLVEKAVNKWNEVEGRSQK